MVNKMAYMAGVIDGDGSFGVRVDAKKWYRPYLQFETTYPELADMLYLCFGGSLLEHKVREGKTRLGKKPTTKYSIGSKQVETLAESIYPYITVKKTQCLIVKDWYKYDASCREKFYIQLAALKNEYIAISPIVRRSDNLCNNAWSYIAGIMDTDGSFSVSTSKKGHQRGTISLTMNCAGAINFIIRNTKEGNLCIVKAKTARKGCQYRFQIQKTTDIKSFLDKLLPYLTIKKNNALKLYNYCINAMQKNGVVKSPLIVLEPLPDNAGGNKEQAGFMPCSLNAVSEETSKDDAVL